MEQNYYEILGIARTATAKQIKTAYNKQAKLHHPDRHAQASEVERNAHEQQFKRAAEAYEVLGDAEERAYYDAHGVSRKERKAKRDSTPLTPAETEIMNLFSAIFDPQADDPRKERYTAKMRAAAAQTQHGYLESTMKLRKAIKNIECLRGRMTKSGATCDTFEAMVEDQLARARAALSQAEKDHALWGDVVTELKTWNYRIDIESDGSMVESASLFQSFGIAFMERR